jgi:GNAT superfamily N-acetyltransferase
MPGFAIRRATAADASVLAHQRAGMFRDMGELPAELHDSLVKASTAYFAKAIPEGRYVAWVAQNRDAPHAPHAPLPAPGEIVGGAGLQLRELLPRPHPERARLMRGPQALILNVFTERSWRRRGVAEALMRELLAWCRENDVESVVLHASNEGRPLYEKLGFVPTNEMRLGGKGGGVKR